MRASPGSMQRSPGWLLLDAGVWVASWSPEEAFAEASQEVIGDTRRRAAALDLTLYEVVNSIAAKRGDAAGAALVCRSIFTRCKKALVRIDSELVEATAAVAAEHKLTSYDAAYVAVARRHDWQLVSTDIRDLVSKGLAVTPDAAV
jgi:predicted nucleic acid-binding protein